MTIKIDHEGKEIEVYTAEEVQARETAAVSAKEAEFGKTKKQIEDERDEARKMLNERTGEFKQFRKLNDEQVAKLTIAEKTIYENGLALEEERKKGADRDKADHQAKIDAAIKAKAGTDDKVFKKMQDTWAIIGIDARTPEEIERKLAMVVGAIRQTEPDLIASIGNFGGGALPGNNNQDKDKSFGETDRGKAGAAELGLTLEPPKKQ